MTVIMHPFQMRTPKHWEVKWLAQDHTAGFDRAGICPRSSWLRPQSLFQTVSFWFLQLQPSIIPERAKHLLKVSQLSTHRAGSGAVSSNIVATTYMWPLKSVTIFTNEAFGSSVKWSIWFLRYTNHTSRADTATWGYCLPIRGSTDTEHSHYHRNFC